MKLHIVGALLSVALLSCNAKNETQSTLENQAANEVKPVESEQPEVTGTWKLLHARIIRQGDTTFTDYTQGKEALKMLNGTHFSFFQHDLSQGKDSATAVFVSGAGRYTLEGNRYTEYLDYCTYRPAENHKFEFNITIKGDTLIQSGFEKLESDEFGVHNTETYIRVSETAG